MFARLCEVARQCSFAVVFAGLMGAFYTEALSVVPPGRSGRPKPPLHVQRWIYGLVNAAGVPGVVWGFVRASRRQQRTPWE